MDFKCRICLQNCNPTFYIKLFETYMNEKSLADTLAQFGAVQVMETDYLPKGICIVCRNQLKDAVLLQKTIQQSDIRFRQELLESHINTKKDIKTEYNIPNTSQVCVVAETEKKKNEIFLQQSGNLNQMIKTENVQNEDETSPEIKTEPDSPLLVDKKEPIEIIENVAISWNCIVDIKEDTVKPYPPYPYKCTVCDEKFTSNRLYFVHCMIHEFKDKNHGDEKLSKASFTSFLEQRGLDSKLEDGQFKCFICERLFSQRNNLDRHYLIHLGIKFYSCQLCDKKFRYVFNLKYHMNSHTGARPFNCPVCKKTFTTPGSLTLHKRSHLKIKPFKCDTCGHTFAQRSQLMEHVPVHTNEKNFVCEYCSKQLKSKSSLCKHLSIHKMAESCMTYNCPTCAKTFGYKSLLTRHLKRHFGEKTHLCSVCQKTFTEKGSLRVHMRIHENVKPYSCKVCMKPFRQLPTLSKHMRVHTGETPFHCQFCTKKFGYKHHLQSHVKKFHGEELVLENEHD